MAKLGQLKGSHLIELIRPDMWSKVKEAVSKKLKFCKVLPSETGIDSENGCCISAKSSFRVGEEGDISTS